METTCEGSMYQWSTLGLQQQIFWGRKGAEAQEAQVCMTDGAVSGCEIGVPWCPEGRPNTAGLTLWKRIYISSKYQTDMVLHSN